MGPLQEILARLGTVKNPVLFTSGAFSISDLYLCKDLFQATNPIAIVTGAVMYLLAVGVVLIGLAFYIYAFLRLPSTAQELVFLQEGSAALARHNASQRVGRAKKRRPDG